MQGNRNTNQRDIGMISARDLKETLSVLPGLMETQRLAMKPAKKGFTPGLRSAAKAVGISPTTYSRMENGHTPDVGTLLKVLDWLKL
jgi:hypothetical protein